MHSLSYHPIITTELIGIVTATISRIVLFIRRIDRRLLMRSARYLISRDVREG